MSSTPRFFVPPQAIRGDQVTLPLEDAHHARAVLRLQAGEQVLVHDGLGTVHGCALTEVSTRAVRAQVETTQPAASEPVTRITVAQALPKTSDKIEQVLQHGTEIGAAGFILWGALRSVAKLGTNDKIDKRLDRWRGIVKASAEQSGRGVLPDIAWANQAQAVAEHTPRFDAALVLHEVAATPLADALAALEPQTNRLLIIIGPEGGLTDDEVAQFARAGVRPISLGPRILRTETAALVALAQILFARELSLPLPS